LKSRFTQAERGYRRELYENSTHSAAGYYAIFLGDFSSDVMAEWFCY